MTLFSLVYVSEVDEDFLVPVWPRLKEYFTVNDEEISIDLGKDEESGCTCRLMPKKWVTCFGSEFCLKFPKNFKIRSRTLRVRNTHIEIIQKYDFIKMSHLHYLEIEANYKLNQIQNGSFFGMTSLKNLSISFNSNLLSLERGSFEGLKNLEELVLIKNGFFTVKDATAALSPIFLPKLIKLRLNENNFPEVQKDDFDSMKGSFLTELGLVLCQIEYIHPESLAPLRNLTTLRLGENIFNTSVITELIRSSVNLSIPLQRLNLYSVGFRKNPPEELMQVIAESNISILSLSRNQFELLRKNSFPYMPKLVQLDLREVLAVNITLDTFSGMPNLRTLLISGNKFPSVPAGVLLPQLTYLDLSFNSNIFTPSYFTLDKNKFRNMSKLWGLNISYNNIHVLFNYSFTGLENLFVLGLKDASIYFIGDATFLPLKKLVFLDLENNPFPKTNPFKKEMFEGLEKLEVLLLGGCSITDFDEDSFYHLQSLKHLGLNGNLIKTLTPVVFRYLPNLERINVAQNLLTPWKTCLFGRNKNLLQILASQNKITYLSDAMVKDFNGLDSLDLSKNPISCDCGLYTSITSSLRKKKNTTLLDLLSEEVTFCVFPNEFNNDTIEEYFNKVVNESNLCPFLPNSILLVGLPLVILTILIIILFIVTYKYRWHIRYWIFLTRMNVIRKGKLFPHSKSSRNYDYDAFVSYSNEDRNFVIRLVAMLENYEPFLKLCVYERDFQIGTIITENVLESVAKSRKTLLVISNSYVKSQWCQWEAQVAENHRLFFENENGDLVNDSIVMIKLGNVSSANMTPMLKYLMKTRIYLQWETDEMKQKSFWRKLRHALAPPNTSISVDTYL